MWNLQSGRVMISLAILLVCVSRSEAYVEIPYTLGRLVQESTHVMLLRVEKVDKTRNLIVYRKVKDIKGDYPGDVVRHNIGQAGFAPREWQTIMQWAEPGKQAVFMHNGSASETCIDGYWYQAYPNGEWWGMSHAEPYMLRSYVGKPEKLATLVQSMLAGQEVITPCMIDGDKAALQNGTARIQRLKASLKIQDYNAPRDFLGWGGNQDFRQLRGMPAFSHQCELPRVDPGASGIAPMDFNGDGKLDFCLYGEARVCVMQNDGKALTEFTLPYSGGARDADWADFNGDGKPDLLLATPSGPVLLENAGETFRDASGALPHEPYYDLKAAKFCDVNGDRRPDVVLSNGLLGWKVYRNLAANEVASSPKPAVSGWHYCGPFDNTNRVGFGTKYPPESSINLKAEYAGKNSTKAIWREGKFEDGKVNSLRVFGGAADDHVTCYLSREFNVSRPIDVPASFGSDDNLQVWLNGVRLISDSSEHGCQPDQHKTVLKLLQGKNQLLLKVCQGTGEFAFYFKCESNLPNEPLRFVDYTQETASSFSSLAVLETPVVSTDFDGDGNADLLVCGEQPLAILSTTTGLQSVADHGLDFKHGVAAPAVGDFDGDKLPDVFLPTASGGKVFRSLGKGHFRDVTAKSGLSTIALGNPTSATFASLEAPNRPGLVIGCLKGPNRYFRHLGGGRFEDATESVGLHQKVFNTRALSGVDFNGDGHCDLLLNNEAQAPVALLGSGALATSERSPSDR